MFWAPLGWIAGWAVHVLVWYEFFVIRFLAGFRFAAAAPPKFASLALAIPLLWITMRYIFKRFSGFRLRNYAG